MNLDFYCANRISDVCHTLTVTLNFGTRATVPGVFWRSVKARALNFFCSIYIMFALEPLGQGIGHLEKATEQF